MNNKEDKAGIGRNTDNVRAMDKDRDDEAEFKEAAFNKFIDNLIPCLHKTKGNLYHRGQMITAMKSAVLMIDDYRDTKKESL